MNTYCTNILQFVNLLLLLLLNRLPPDITDGQRLVKKQFYGFTIFIQYITIIGVKR
jgi:hypothetical protein